MIVFLGIYWWLNLDWFMEYHITKLLIKYNSLTLAFKKTNLFCNKLDTAFYV